MKDDAPEGSVEETIKKSYVTKNWRRFLLKMPSLLLGLFLFAMGVVANLYSNLGTAPWIVLHVGLSKITPLTLGQVSQLVGFVVLVIGWFLGFPPGLSTLANMYFIGYFIDLIMMWNMLPMPSNLVGQYAMLLFSVAMIGVASLFYMRVQLGAGPRDGLMVGLVTKLDRPVSTIRTAIEGTVLVIGYLLGGPIGIGTLVNALLLGPVVQTSFRLGGFNAKSEQVNLYNLAKCLSGKGELP